MVIEDTLSQIETQLHKEFPSVKMEFATQSFSNHLELWVYVLDINAYEHVQESCRRIAEAEKLEKRDPEVWLMAKTWTGPWPGGEAEQEIKQRREEFRRRHPVA